VRLEAEHVVVFVEHLLGLHHLREHARCRRVVGGLAVDEVERVRVGRERHTTPARHQRLGLRDELRVPALVEVHVRVDLEEPVFPVVQAHRDGARPARTARVQGVDAHVAHARADTLQHEAGHLHRPLVDDAEVQGVGMARLRQCTVERVTQDRVAVGGDADEDAHGRSRTLSRHVSFSWRVSSCSGKALC
jgi:hypothetical protein